MQVVHTHAATFFFCHFSTICKRVMLSLSVHVSENSKMFCTCFAFIKKKKNFDISMCKVCMVQRCSCTHVSVYIYICSRRPIQRYVHVSPYNAVWTVTLSPCCHFNTQRRRQAPGMSHFSNLGPYAPCVIPCHACKRGNIIGSLTCVCTSVYVHMDAHGCCARGGFINFNIYVTTAVWRRIFNFLS